MEKIERYLEEVCRRIGGPRPMRAHIRQELREHLLDAVERLRSAGMTEEEAVTKALEDFGGPEEVRGALEEAHGHRLTAVIVEKAMQWKEKTMKARWLWMTVAHAAVIGLVFLEVLYVLAAMIFVVPKYRDFVKIGWISVSGPGTEFNAWAVNYLLRVTDWCENWWMILLPVALLWGLFEWRVRSENKSWIRLSIAGTMGVAMLVICALTTAALAIPPLIEMPLLVERSPDIVSVAAKNLDRDEPLMQEAVEKKDWDGVERYGGAIRDELQQLKSFWAIGPVMMGTMDHSAIVAGRKALGEASNTVLRLQIAASTHEETAARDEMRRFREILATVRGGGTTKPSATE